MRQGWNERNARKKRCDRRRCREARRATQAGWRDGACIAGGDTHHALEWRQSAGWRLQPSNQCDESPHRLLSHGPAAANAPQARVSWAPSGPSTANAQTRVCAVHRRNRTPASNRSTQLAIRCRVQTTACTAVGGATTPPSSRQDAARDRDGGTAGKLASGVS